MAEEEDPDWIGKQEQTNRIEFQQECIPQAIRCMDILWQCGPVVEMETTADRACEQTDRRRDMWNIRLTPRSSAGSTSARRSAGSDVLSHSEDTDRWSNMSQRLSC